MFSRSKIPAPPADSIDKGGKAGSPSGVTLKRSNTQKSSSADSIKSSASASSHYSRAAAGSLRADPTDILLDRATGWLSLVRTLVTEVEELITSTAQTTAAHTKINKAWLQPPGPRDRDLAFSPGPGTITTLITTLQSQSSKLAEENQLTLNALVSQTLPALTTLLKDVNKKISALSEEKRSMRKQVAKEREVLRGLEKRLEAALDAARAAGGRDALKAGDPFLANLAIRTHLSHMTTTHTTRTTTRLTTRSTFATWESSLISNLRTGLSAYTSLHTPGTSTSHLAPLHTAVENLDVNGEWDAYRAERLDELDDGMIQAPVMLVEGSNDPLCTVIYEGGVKRKLKLSKKVVERWVVVTAAGWLHEYEAKPDLDAIVDDTIEGTTPPPAVTDAASDKENDREKEGEKAQEKEKPKKAKPTQPTTSIWLRECSLNLTDATDITLTYGDQTGLWSTVGGVVGKGVSVAVSVKLNSYKFAPPTPQLEEWMQLLTPLVNGKQSSQTPKLPNRKRSASAGAAAGAAAERAGELMRGMGTLLRKKREDKPRASEETKRELVISGPVELMDGVVAAAAEKEKGKGKAPE
ncbi:hypothetical protein HK104_002584 [Borealophlyctis nickersoniae]|nr:hypothetical protein HK104_002584 [Borealophlyctis nickersoniae]